MKNLLYFIALSVSIFFTACSSNEHDIMPLSPSVGIEKISPDINPSYQYLQSFTEIKNLKLEIFDDKDGITLVIHSKLGGLNHLYAVVEQQVKNLTSLVFLGNSNEGKFLIKGLRKDLIGNIKIYGLNSYKLPAAPFSPPTLFNKIFVKGWSSSESYIKVSSGQFPSGLTYLFTELKTKKGSFLVFLDRPVSEDFEIPKYGEFGIIELNLFGYSQKLFTEN